MGNGLCGGYDAQIEREEAELADRIRKNLKCSDDSSLLFLLDFVKSCKYGVIELSDIQTKSSYLTELLEKNNG